MKKVRELLLYIVAGIGVAAGLVAMAGIATYTWYSFSCFTILLAGVLAKMYWPARKSAKVWLLLALFMAVHIIAYTFLLQRVREWPSLLYLLTGPGEVMLFAVIAKILLDVLPPKVKL
jgi:hypothetical protein